MNENTKNIKIEVEIGENLKSLLNTFSSAIEINATLTSIFKDVSENADKFIVSSKIDEKCMCAHSWKCIDGWSDVVCRCSTPGALTFSVKYEKFECEKCGEIKIENDSAKLP